MNKRQEKLDALLRKNKIKRKDIAEMLKVSPSFISAVVSGKKNLPLEKAVYLLEQGIPGEIVENLVAKKYKKLIQAYCSVFFDDTPE